MAGLAAGLLLTAGSAGAAELLSGEEMRELLFGNTLTGSHASVGAAWNAYVAPDGAIHIRGTRKEGAYEFFGTVTIEDDLWCENWKIVNFQMKCRRISRDGEYFSVIRDDGKVLSSFIVRPGDPEGLSGGAPAPEITETPPAAPEQTIEPAPQPANQAANQAAASDGVMGNDVVLRLHQIGQSEDSIVELIQKSPSDFDLSPAALDQLRAAGVGTPVISAMLASKLGAGGQVAPTAAQPAAGEAEEEVVLPKSKSAQEGSAAAPDSASAPETAPAVEAAAVAQPTEQPAAGGQVIEPAATEVAVAMPDLDLPEGRGLYAMMGAEPVQIPLTDVEIMIGLRMAGTEKHNSAVDGFGDTPSAVLPRAPESFIVSAADFDPNSLRLSQLGYMAERRADQFNLLGIEPAYFASVYGRDPTEKILIGLWRPKTVIDLVVEPVAGKAGLFRLTPTEPLPEGRYAFHQGGAVHPYDEVFLVEGRPGARAFYFAVGNP